MIFRLPSARRAARPVVRAAGLPVAVGGRAVLETAVVRGREAEVREGIMVEAVRGKDPAGRIAPGDRPAAHPAEGRVGQSFFV